MDEKNNHRYWASAPIEEIAAEVESKFDEYLDQLDKSGYLTKVYAMYTHYYGVGDGGTFQVTTKEDGVVKRIKVNHFKNLLKRLHILVTQNKLAFVARARNSDIQSQLEADLAKGILDYYTEEKALGQQFSLAVETALVCLEAFLHTPWNLHKGMDLTVDMETGTEVKTGDQDFEVLTALDVARNIGLKDSPWFIVRCRKNKWDLAALHPTFAEEIKAGDADRLYRLSADLGQYEDDLVDVLYFYHAKTPSMPEGRYSVVCNSQVLADGPLAYKRPPVFRLAAGDVIDNIWGDSPAVELAAMQEVIDALYSATVTNNVNFAQQNIWSQDPNLSVHKITEGQNLIVSAAKPEALQLTNSAKETYDLIKMLQDQQQLLSGINATARGTPEASLKSGNSLALMLAQAVQYVSDLQKNYAQLASDVGTCVINNLQQFAKGEMLVVIGGQSKRSYIDSFTSQDLINIDRVTVDLGNPLLDSYAGRYEMVQQWMQFGTVQNPKVIVEFLKTGQVDSIIEGDFKDMVLVRDENEMLKEANVERLPIVLRTDDHPYHIEEHRQLLSDPEVRYNPQIVDAVLSHIEEHEMFMMPPQPVDPATGQPIEPMPPDDPNAQLPPEQQANLPSVPEGTPPEAAANYEQATQGIEQ